MAYNYADYHHHQFDRQFSLPLPMPSPTSCWYPQRQDVQFGYSYPDSEYTLPLQIAQSHLPTCWDNPWQPPQQYQQPPYQPFQPPSPPYQPPQYTPDLDPNLSMAALVSQLERLTADVEQLVSRMDANECCPVDPHAAIQPPPAPPLSIPYTTPVLCPLQQPTAASPAVLHHVLHQVSMPYSPDLSSYSAAPYAVQSLVTLDITGSLQQQHHFRKQLAGPFTKDATHIEHPLASIAKLESRLDDTDRHVGELHAQPRPPPAPPNGQLLGSHMGPFLELQIEQVVKVEEKLLDDEGDGGSNPLSVIDSVKSPLGCISTPLEYISTILKSSEWKRCINWSLEHLPESNDLYLHSIWRNSSKFSDIYYEVHFVKTAEHDVVVMLLDERIKRLSPFARKGGLVMEESIFANTMEILEKRENTCVFDPGGDIWLKPPPPSEELYPQPEDRPSRSLLLPDRTLHPPSWLPSYSQPAAAAVRQPPQLHSSSSWIDMPQQHVQNSVPTFTASTISTTATTQDRSYHEHPVVVHQPLLLHPTSPCCSAVMPSVAAAVPVLLKEARYWSGKKVGVIVALPQQEVREVKSVVNLRELFGNFANDVIYRVALGRKYDDGEEFKKASEELGVLLARFDVGELVPCVYWIKFVNGMSGRVRGVAGYIDEFLEFVVREHISKRKEGEKDFVDDLLETPRNERCGFALDHISIKALIFDMFAAGNDTTITLIEWKLSKLIRHTKAKNEFFSRWMSIHFVSYVQVVSVCIYLIQVGIPRQSFVSPHSSFLSWFPP